LRKVTRFTGPSRAAAASAARITTAGLLPPAAAPAAAAAADYPSSIAEPKAPSRLATTAAASGRLSKDDLDIENFGSTRFDLGGQKDGGPAAAFGAAGTAGAAAAGAPSASQALTAEQIDVSRRWLTRPCSIGDPPVQ